MVWLRFQVVSEPIVNSASARVDHQVVSTGLLLFRGGPYRAVAGEPVPEVDCGFNHVVIRVRLRSFRVKNGTYVALSPYVFAA